MLKTERFFNTFREGVAVVTAARFLRHERTLPRIRSDLGQSQGGWICSACGFTLFGRLLSISSCNGSDIPGSRLNEFAEAAGAAASRRLCCRDTERRGEFLITVKVDVVDAHFASLNTIHYLLKVLVFDLQSITDQ